MHRENLSEISNFQIRWGIALLGQRDWQINFWILDGDNTLRREQDLGYFPRSIRKALR